jgi:hypothetical protein
MGYLLIIERSNFRLLRTGAVANTFGAPAAEPQHSAVRPVLFICGIDAGHP